ncbi:hypothetical protein [Hamadaea tsunoensis]|uniref:hypothetical protein n=1 Tax=Hamadaea tsunoensis TaxID=53368 RepID=UPI00040F9751|nr:hypothetical protein [Hamadaea tsunoensis]
MTLSAATMPHNLRLIGGEMLVWTDNEPRRERRPAGGGALEELLRGLARPGGRVLVAGPHAPGVIELLDRADMQITCLLRAYPDAAELAARHPGVQVLCGSVAKVETEDPYDLVVALDGAERLVSVEGVTMSWGEVAAVLARSVAAGGALVFGQENLLGVQRLVRMAPWYADRTDGDWTPLGEYDETRPDSPADLDRRLTELGLTVHDRLLGFATPGEPVVLFTDDLAQDVALGGFLRAAVSAAAGAQYAGVPVLSDPRALAASAVRNGAAATFAPVWFAVATKPGAAVPSGSRVIVSEPGTASWNLRYEVVRSSAGWARRLLGDPAPVSRDVLRRDPAALAGPLPTGQVLEERLLELCLRRDLPELARLLTRYAGWLAAAAGQSGELTGTALCATPDEILVSGDDFAYLDATWSADLRTPVDVALARALREFAVKLITGGYSHPWPMTADADSLTVILGGLAGYALERPQLTEAVSVEVRLSAARNGLDEAATEALRTQLASVVSGTPPLDLDSHRELRMALERMRDDLTHAQARTAWAEELLLSREKALRWAEQKLEILNGSLSYRTGRLVMWPLRKIKLLLMKVLKKQEKSAD